MPNLPVLHGVRIGSAAGSDFIPLRPTVDITADHTMIPASVLKELQVPELETKPFHQADGAIAEFTMGTARLEIDGRVRPCPVVFGPGETPLLGASTLEIFNLDYDPNAHRLIPNRNLSLGMVDADGNLTALPTPVRPTAVAPRDGYRIWLRFSDGAEGEVDLSHLAGQGVFQQWENREFFESVSIAAGGGISWGNSIELCPDTLYAELAGQTV